MLPITESSFQSEPDGDDHDTCPKAGLEQQSLWAAIPAESNDAPDQNHSDDQGEGINFHPPDLASINQCQNEQPASTEATTQI
ncbi:MAG: hypothetical protein RL015_1281 [Verrucomicrobiota bacterium]